MTPTEFRESVPGPHHIAVGWPQGLFAYRQGPREQGLSLGILALGNIEYTQIVQGSTKKSGSGAQGLFCYGEGPLEQALRLGIFALGEIQFPQKVQGYTKRGVVWDK